MTIIFLKQKYALLQKLIKINGCLLFLPSRSVSRSQRLSLAILGDSFLRSPHEATSFEGAPLGQLVAFGEQNKMKGTIIKNKNYRKLWRLCRSLEDASL